MEQKNKLSTSALLLCIVLTLFFWILAILTINVSVIRTSTFPVTVRTNISWMPVVFIVFSIVCFLPVIRTLLSVLHERKILPEALEGFFQEGFQRKVTAYQNAISTYLSRLSVQLAFAGLAAIFIAGSIVQIGFINLRIPNADIYRLLSVVKKKAIHQNQQRLVEVAPIFSAGLDQEQYHAAYLAAVLALKEIGVKAVLIQAEEMRGERIRLMKDLAKTGIVVFGLNYGSKLLFLDSLGKVIPLPMAAKTIPIRELGWSNSLSCIQPFGVPQSIRSSFELTTEWERRRDAPVPDIAIELLRKHLSYADTVTLIRKDNAIIFGNVVLPLTKDQRVYYRASFSPLSEYDAFHSVVQAEIRPSTKKNNVIDAENQKEYIKDPLRLRMGYNEQRYQGKIVFLEEARSNVYSGWGGKYSYVEAVESILGGKLITIAEKTPYWVMAICILATALLVYYLRFLLASLSVVALALLLLSGGAYLFYNNNYLIDMTLPLLAVIISLPLFSVVKYVHLWSGGNYFSADT
ncbi:MAG: hypothetical protein V1799_04000 [bacterium]